MNHYRKFLVTAAIYIGLLYSITGCSSIHSQEERQATKERQPSAALKTLEEKLTPGRSTTEEADRLLEMIWKNTVKTDPNNL